MPIRKHFDFLFLHLIIYDHLRNPRDVHFMPMHSPWDCHWRTPSFGTVIPSCCYQRFHSLDRPLKNVAPARSNVGKLQHFFFSKLRRLWNAVENVGQAGSSLEQWGIFQFSHGFFAISHGFGANPFQSQGSQGSQELRTQLIAHNGSVQKLDLPEDMKAPLCLHRCVWWSKGRRVAPTHDGHKGVNWPWRMTRKHWVWRYEAETVGGLSPFFSSVLLHNMYIYIYICTQYIYIHEYKYW